MRASKEITISLHCPLGDYEMAASDYPVQLEIDYPEEPNRLTTLFRVFLAIPILIVGAFVLGGY